MKVRYHVPRTSLLGFTDLAVLVASDSSAAVAEQAMDALMADVVIEIAGVRMHAAGWADPDHWSEDWQLLAGPGQDVETFIALTLARAVEE